MKLARKYGGKERFGQGSRKRIDNEGALIRARVVCVFLPFGRNRSVSCLVNGVRCHSDPVALRCANLILKSARED